MPDTIGTARGTLAAELDDVIADVRRGSARWDGDLAEIHPRLAASAENLVRYLALRELELRPLQLRLERAGLSSLGRLEAHVMPTLERVRRAAAALAGEVPPESAGGCPEEAFEECRERLEANTRLLVGSAASGRHTRIMVTLPTEAADDGELLDDIVRSGADCVRINLAHDDEDVWRGMVRNARRAGRRAGRRVRIAVDLPGPKLRTGEIARDGAGKRVKIRLFTGDSLILTAAATPGRPTVRGQGGEVVRPARIPCTLPEVFRYLEPGQPVHIDDGRLAAVVEGVSPDAVRLRVTSAGPKGERVRSGKGINLPRTHLPVSCLTAEDVELLPFAAECADIVQMSFVQDPADVTALHEVLQRLGAPDLGVVLKVETVRAFEALPRLVLAGMRGPSLGVMIARGDLAVEAGFERLAEVQEEILWLCEAAHVPVIWATEVLDGLAHTGRVRRGEVTDAAMGARAECVMLNRGDRIIDAIRLLDGILTRMQDQKSPLLRPLRAWSDSGPGGG